MEYTYNSLPDSELAHEYLLAKDKVKKAAEAEKKIKAVLEKRLSEGQELDVRGVRYVWTWVRSANVRYKAALDKAKEMLTPDAVVVLEECVGDMTGEKVSKSLKPVDN